VLETARILVVEDDVRVRETFTRALQLAGYEVVEAADGRAALQLWARSAVDLVVTDIYLPEMDGYELIRAIRKDRPAVPVVVVSGGGETGYPPRVALEIAGRLGVSRTLAKPVDLRDLLAAVRHLLGPSPGQPTPVPRA
jgi:CheY-like chemotaxis protein